MGARRRTATSSFGAGARESHDASRFYDRFRPPLISADDVVAPPLAVPDPFVCGDARNMALVADRSVALVVTSPPYFTGKQYELEVERDGVPGSYLEFLQMLTEVFAECARALEPGGRIAVNVANLGRKPYRSLSADVIRILQDDLGLLLRGEVIWQKGEGANSSCAWGSFRSAVNPVLRDVTERVVVASKGRFDRARSVRRRAAEGLPSESTMLTDDFTSATLDVWTIPAESASRVGHPAPFPVELPERLIRLYTFAGDLVLDPFMGSGTTLLAAARLGRRYVGYDVDAGYVELARRRLTAWHQHPDGVPGSPGPAGLVEGPAAGRLAEQVVEGAGFTIEGRHRRIAGTGVTVDLVATDTTGGAWLFVVGGRFTSERGGLLRTDVVWRMLGRAAALRSGRGDAPLVLLTTQLPRRPGEGDTALRAAGPGLFFDVAGMLDPDDRDRLARYAKDGRAGGPLPGFWEATDLASPG